MVGLSDEDKAIYEWQLSIPGFGEAGQEILRNSTALVSRCGGLGGPLAFQLAAAGFGKLVIAHGGNLKHSDLNRQILMSYDKLGQPRSETIKETLNRFNPNIDVETIDANITEDNAAELVGKVDIIFDAAPLFEERFLMNREAVLQRKPMIDAAMFNMEGQVITIVPGKTPCLACLFPEVPPHWKRQFPVIGALSALVANIAALEGIKHLTGLGQVNYNKMIYLNGMDMSMSKIGIERNPHCPQCASLFTS
ncbi:MAG: HesA/MoeB/ThiF family protein [Lentisphaeria bacterium]|nr:HesA/MoeB/ThiF family protein [Lentisphaeria bacterium]NQZ68485.1 HesA/MoeB/ThiF family protein [Lentisphaeria bacterium]